MIHKYTFTGWYILLSNYWFYSIFGWMADLWMCTFWFLKSCYRLVWLFSVSVIQQNFDLKKIEAIPPIVYNDGYLHKKVWGKTSSLVALCHYMCLYKGTLEKRMQFSILFFSKKLSTETPTYQVGWGILATSRLLDTLKPNFYLVWWKFFQPTLLHIHQKYIRIIES